MFSISPDGALQFKAGIVASPPADGVGAWPRRSDQIDSVIDAVTVARRHRRQSRKVKEATPEEVQERPVQTAARKPPPPPGTNWICD